MSPKARPEFQLQAAARIRDEIVAGRYQPGERLPTYADMGRTYSFSKMTLQLAIALLKQQGFVASEERKGLFVHESPPHRKRYAFAVPASEERSWFWRSLSREFDGVVRSRRGEPVRFREIESRVPGIGDLSALLEQAEDQRVAGVVFPYNPPVWPELARIPQVTISCVPFPHGGRVDLDWDSFARQSVAWMRQCGRRRIALIGLGESPILEGTERELARVGLPAPPAWVLTAKHPPTANAITQLLMSLPRSARPDGIIVVDDDVVGYVWEGLKASGVQLGKTLDVVSHVNWPWPAVSGVPVRRLGYDMRDALRRSLDMIDAMRAGRTFQRLELIPAIFEESVEKPSDRLKESSPA